ncbi:XRE family transcriptional regulator [Paraflavitalea soli]|uniref:XRE family transcriptional regulator n=1 Tax=Paraflavitalea soli TaxID=2315862 RepID=A0A3B7MV87_9BACT|nr:XRE family transcriptional regulator [Paraflavitalea soli]
MAKRLNQLREEFGHTQTGVAEAIGVKVSQYQHYEAGRACPPFDKLILLADLYGVTLDGLIKMKVQSKVI